MRIGTAGEWDKNSPPSLLRYAVGPLLYSPAGRPDTAEILCHARYSGLQSMALCLEDAVMDGYVEEAERLLAESMREIHTRLQNQEASLSDLPLIFIRIRNPKQLRRMCGMLESSLSVAAGFILPKASPESLNQCMELLQEEGGFSQERNLYLMPIVESGEAIRLESRARFLAELRDAASRWGERVLNIRVGGNDFCGRYGLRRRREQSIYEIGVVRDALADIINVFSLDYVVSGPVYEYYGEKGGPWEKSFRREIELDRANGFVGKTVIHPSQLGPVREALTVSPQDYQDAQSILHWANQEQAVQGGEGGRMNEVKVHKKWAERINGLAQVYGIRQEDQDGND